MPTTLLCLHGWGGTKESFSELRSALAGTDITILTPDLPGFGNEPEPTRPWSTDDYADWVLEWLKKNSPHPTPLPPRIGKTQSFLQSNPADRFFLLGHSHGGRIAIKLVAPCSLLPTHLFLCASAGIRHPRHFKRILGLTLAKTGKFFLSIPGLKALEPLGKKFLYRLVRVHDYEYASPVMRETLIKVSAEDVRSLLLKITVPTDIFWGEDDRMTPVSDAHLMHRLIPGSTLHLYPGVRHRVHRDRAKEVAEVIRERLEKSP